MKNFSLMMLFLCIFFGGCAAAPFVITPIVTGVIYWKEGEARKYYAEDSFVLHRAAVLALQQLDQPITSDVKNTDLSYSITGGDSHKVKISIKAVRKHISEVRIRVNFMGDKPFAEMLYKQIDANTSTIEYDADGYPTKLKKN